MPRANNSQTTIKMLKTSLGSPTGIVTLTYEKDKVYTIPSSLAKVFIDQKWAVVSKGSEEKAPDVDPGEPTGALILPMGMISRGQLVKDEMSNKELIEYAEMHLGVEKGSIKANANHATLLENVVRLQQDFEETLQEKDEEED